MQLLATAAFLFAFASLTHAQATRTWVSGVGDDVNPCSRTAPCKTFAGAISKTADGGEIDALDPGGFGAVTITKSITIDGTGTFASILSSGTNGVIINAAGKDVTLRGLSINGAGTGFNGIRFLAGNKLNVIDCFIQGVTTHGIDVAQANTGTVTVFVLNTVIKRCGGDGISLSGGTGALRTTLERVSLVENNNGLHARNGSANFVNAANSVFSLNAAVGVFADANGAGAVNTIRVSSSQISLNGTNGVQSGNGGNAGTSGVGIAGNSINFNGGNGVLISTGGTVQTFTNNSILGNGTNGCAGCANVAPGN